MVKGILVAGATGEVGKRLVEKLIVQNPSTPIHALVRRVSDSIPKEVTQHVVDFDNLDTIVLTEAFYMAYCCLGTTIKQAGSKQAFKNVDYGYVLAFAHLAQRHGINHFCCISAVGANKHASNFYLAVKGETEHHLSQMNWHQLWLVRPSLLLGPRTEFRLAEYLGGILSRVISPFLKGPLLKYKPIHMIQVAEVMARLIRKDVTTDGTTVLEGKALFKA